MSNGRRKYLSREYREKVREILMKEWDPIGVQDLVGAEDEYDRYAAKAYVMLMDEHATAPAIAAYLFDIATGHMGLPVYAGLTERYAKTAEILVQLRPQFSVH
ncbi:MAG TPA: hypothetical protein VM689_17740 [Aliidongia sp.]|nr:hypothetical protein [Aliidongia sp.]